MYRECGQLVKFDCSLAKIGLKMAIGQLLFCALLGKHPNLMALPHIYTHIQAHMHALLNFGCRDDTFWGVRGNV